MSKSSSKKIKVLLDISLSSTGYSGIPQDGRLLFRTLSKLKDVDVTCLIWGRRDEVLTHKFVDSKLKGDRLANQALYLESIVSEDINEKKWMVLKVLKIINTMFRLVFSRQIQTQLLDTHEHWSVIWRHFLSYSLKTEDIELVKKSKFLLANTGIRPINIRLLSGWLSPQLDTHEYDIVIFQDSRSVKVSKNTKKVIRYFDAVPLLYPDLTTNRLGILIHHKSIQKCIKDKSLFVCCSEPTRQDLIRAYPSIEKRAFTVSCPLSDVFYNEPSRNLLKSIFSKRVCYQASSSKQLSFDPQKHQYFLAVSTIEPRKNYKSLLDAFEILKNKHNNPNLKLVIVGKAGWKYKSVMNQMKPLIEAGDLIHLWQVNTNELRIIYSNAIALIFPSYYEGFGFPPTEAVLCKTPIIISKNPVHEWIWQDKATYCDPYDIGSLVQAMDMVFEKFTKQEGYGELIEESLGRLKEFQEEEINGKWESILRGKILNN